MKYHILYLVIILFSLLMVQIIGDAFDKVSTKDVEAGLRPSGLKMSIYHSLIDFFSILWKLTIVSMVLLIIIQYSSLVNKSYFFFISSLIALTSISFLATLLI